MIYSICKKTPGRIRESLGRRRGFPDWAWELANLDRELVEPSETSWNKLSLSLSLSLSLYLNDKLFCTSANLQCENESKQKTREEEGGRQ